MKSRHHRDLFQLWYKAEAYKALLTDNTTMQFFTCQCCQLTLSMMLMLILMPSHFYPQFSINPPAHKHFCYDNVIFLFTIIVCWCCPLACQCPSAPPQRICCNVIRVGQSTTHCPSAAKLLPLPAISAVHLFFSGVQTARKPWMGGNLIRPIDYHQADCGGGSRLK